ncbi:VOC family protein [Brevundimonas sp. 2R-24]|uniref:VOC family protein n=1 Tax=Peiella sedimenti TaxID=3061083 RepID=A0ABT8SL69_9CAUL|nr:VOC family protein [Caulobacteraceae bacterium XZ-24]
MLETRITAVTLGVADVERSLAFYARLGWKPRAQFPGVAFISLNGLVLCLYADLASDSGTSSRSASGGLVAVAHNVRNRDQVDEALTLAEEAGAAITRPAHDADWGGRSGYFADPDGHLWEVAWNPHWPMDEQGRVNLGG